VLQFQAPIVNIIVVIIFRYFIFCCTPQNVTNVGYKNVFAPFSHNQTVPPLSKWWHHSSQSYSTGYIWSVSRGVQSKQWRQSTTLLGAKQGHTQALMEGVFVPSSPPLPFPFLPLPSPLLRSRSPLNQLEGMGERCKLHQQGPEQSPGQKRIWCTLEPSESQWQCTLKQFMYFY